jgi:UDP-2,3-diacylglucosamine hydrolase
VERALGLMCGAGAMPARMAREARQRGWRVVAFAFADPSVVGPHADRTIPSRFADLGPILDALGSEAITAALFSGQFSLGEVLRDGVPDAAARALGDDHPSLRGIDLAQAAMAGLAAMGIEVLDQRAFLGDALEGPGCPTARAPAAEEWDDVRRGLDVARRLADAHVGQTVVLKRGAVVAVEAVEGTTETIRRGTALGGPGTVIVKAVARDHDYRFDTPTIGWQTIEAATAGRAAVLALEAGRVLVLDRDDVVRAADAAGLALVGVA